MQEKSVKYTEISERINQVIDYLSTTPNKFAKKLGYDRGQTIYDILNGKSAPSFDFFHRLYSSEYSARINPIWLLTGNGNMTEEVSFANSNESIIKNCKVCSQKDQTILALKETNIVLRDSLELYKEKIDEIKAVQGQNNISSQSASG